MNSGSAETPGFIRTPWLELALQGAHLVSCRLPGGNPLFLASKARFAPGSAIRGGIPVIFPWFGDAPEGSGLGPHGFARTADWTLLEQDDDGREVTLELLESDATRAQWPYAFRLELRIRVGEALELELHTENSGPVPFEYEAALHTYLAVEDVRRTRVHGLENARYFDKPDGFAEKRQGPAPVGFPGEIDRVYPNHGASVRVEDLAGERNLLVAKRRARTTIVWNPGPDKGRGLADLGEEWSRFVCVESANAGLDRRRLEPGAAESMHVTIALA